MLPVHYQRQLEVARRMHKSFKDNSINIMIETKTCVEKATGINHTAK